MGLGLGLGPGVGSSPCSAQGGSCDLLGSGFDELAKMTRAEYKKDGQVRFRVRKL